MNANRSTSCPTETTRTYDRPTPACRGTPVKRRAANTSRRGRTASAMSPPTSVNAVARSRFVECRRRWQNYVDLLKMVSCRWRNLIRAYHLGTAWHSPGPCDGRLMISMYLNCAQVWVRLVRLWRRLTRRPQVTYGAQPDHRDRSIETSPIDTSP
jgi:hypothetical protein